MDRIIIKCRLAGQDKVTELQLDKKAMPGETGLSFMISVDGCFQGYITKPKNGNYRAIGMNYFTVQDLQAITEQIKIAELKTP